jgi:hypothetical protein
MAASFFTIFQAMFSFRLTADRMSAFPCVSSLSQACLTVFETSLFMYQKGLSAVISRNFASFCAIHFVYFNKKLIKVNKRLGRI